MESHLSLARAGVLNGSPEHANVNWLTQLNPAYKAWVLRQLGNEEEPAQFLKEQDDRIEMVYETPRWWWETIKELTGHSLPPIKLVGSFNVDNSYWCHGCERTSDNDQVPPRSDHCAYCHGCRFLRHKNSVYYQKIGYILQILEEFNIRLPSEDHCFCLKHLDAIVMCIRRFDLRRRRQLANNRAPESGGDESGDTEQEEAPEQPRQRRRLSRSNAN